MKKKGTYNQKRSRRRRRRKGLGLVMSFICLVLVIVSLLSAAVIFFKIAEIEVVGDSRYSDEVIVAASKLEMGSSMFLFNKFASINSIFSQCPYIDELVMRRTLPDKVQIIVSECVPIAIIQAEAKWYIMDIKGKLVEEITPTGGEGLIIITGAQIKTAELGKYITFSDEEAGKALFSILNTAKNNDILVNIDNLDISKAYDIRMGYLGRFEVKLGTADHLEKKMRFLAAVLDELSPNDKGTIDISEGDVARFIAKN